ncbi:MAG: hypothetical protein IJF12_05395 [Alphaproteobacteria bacterium]|nr:hypothetical protein [Alphaproteobacteria bacterium]
MKFTKKTFFSTLMLALTVATVPALAQTEEDTTKPRAVLFKIHDIKPVSNADGMVTHCDFMTTFYNRSTDSLRYAKLELGWTDKVSDKYFNNEENLEEEQPKAESRNNKKDNEVLGNVTTVVDMPALGSYKQMSVKSTLKSDKCFLLLDNLNFKVKSCSLVSSDSAKTNARARANADAAPAECAQLFEYVNFNNPEYYAEFKNVSYSEQERMIAEDQKQDISDLETSYQGVVRNFQKAQSVLDDIQ